MRKTCEKATVKRMLFFSQQKHRNPETHRQLLELLMGCLKITFAVNVFLCWSVGVTSSFPLQGASGSSGGNGAPGTPGRAVSAHG